MAPSFSARRLWYLLRGDFLAAWPMLAWSAGIAAATLFAVSLQDFIYGYVEPSMHQDLYGYGLFIWGIIATSMAFRQLDDRTRRESYLLLPASALEKTLARLLPVTLGLGIALPVYFLVLSVLMESFNLAVFGIQRPLFDPFDPGIWKLFGYYLILQSPFFLGAVWFGRFSFILTTLVLLVFHIGLALLVLAATWLALGSPGWQFGEAPAIHPGLHAENYDVLDFMLFGVVDNVLVNLLNPDWDTQIAILYGVLILIPPVLWWIAWLRLREVQANG